MQGELLALKRVNRHLAELALHLAEVRKFINHCTEDMPDSVEHPEHYTAGKIEVIEVLEDWVKHAPNPVMGGLQWQVLKYTSRMWLKGNPAEDAKKARWYLNRLINKLAAAPYEK
jgi:hypothetical protein